MDNTLKTCLSGFANSKSKTYSEIQESGHAFTTDHGPRLYVCQAPNAFMCVSNVAPPKHQMRLYVCHQMRLYVCHQMRLLNPQRNGTRFARLPLLASLARFFNNLNKNSCPKSILV